MNATTAEKFQMNSTEFVDNVQNTTQSVDEVDFVRSVSNPPLKTHSIPRDGNNKAKLALISTHQCPLLAKKLAPGTLYGDCEVKTSIKSSLSTLEKFSIFNLHKKKNEVTAGHTVKDRHKFVKSASIARLLGNSYNTKKSESDMKIANDAAIANGSPISGARRFGGTERFQKCSNLEDALSEVCLQDFREDKDLSTKAFRTISRSLGKLWWKRSHSVDISIPDPEFKVSYLGNVLTGWAKGDGCVEKPLNTLWRNYTQNHKPDVIMRVKVCASGLKATTRQHGLTEYWANRITHCCSPKNYPRVFCWIYRHEGRKLKHELRCHAVLCSKESIAQDICKTLRDNLDRALRDFKREKLSKQNARLSLANSVYENPSLPRRKILLSVGGNNYRPPLERSKSAPKLMAIEEAIGEEDGEEIEETNEPEMQPCCQRDSLYPAMTLGRRRCRRGHSIRRTGKGFIKPNPNTNPFEENATKECTEDIKEDHDEKTETTKATEERAKTKSESSLTSEEDDLDKLLCYNDYDTNSPLAGELLSYFDMKMKPKTLSLTDLNDDTLVFEPTLTTNPKPRPLSSLSLDHLDNCSGDDDDYDDLDEANEVFYQHSTILNLLQRGSLRKVANLSISSSDDSNSIESSKPTPSSVLALAQQQHLDSDEGSISSGCETASTVTANMDDTSLKYTPQNNNQSQPNTTEEDPIPRIPDGSNHQNSELNNNGDKKFRTCSIQFKIPRSPGVLRRTKGKALSIKEEVDISDSEFSDESGYVEFQEQNSIQNKKSVSV